jgi:hypothetical protein
MGSSPNLPFRRGQDARPRGEKVKISGIGCFAGPAVLSRVFQKLTSGYALACEPEPAPALEEIAELQQVRITGIYLALLDRQLHVLIFARGKNNRKKRLRVNLTELTRLRQTRLH